jgi:hypothetical protein
LSVVAVCCLLCLMYAGATGATGKYTVEELLKLNHQVLAVCCLLSVVHSPLFVVCLLEPRVRPANTQGRSSRNSTGRWWLSAACCLMSTFCCLLSRCWSHGRDQPTCSGVTFKPHQQVVLSFDCPLSVGCFMLSDICCLLSDVGSRSWSHGRDQQTCS